MLVETGIPMEQVRLIRLGSSQKGKRVGRIEKTYSQDEMIDFVNVYERKRDLYEWNEERKGWTSFCNRLDEANSAGGF